LCGSLRGSLIYDSFETMNEITAYYLYICVCLYYFSCLGFIVRVYVHPIIIVRSHVTYFLYLNKENKITYSDKDTVQEVWEAFFF
jgi:hypothetical protein